MAWATASAAALVGIAAATVLAAGGAHAAIMPPRPLRPLSGMQSTPVADGAYTVQNNQWGSSGQDTVMADGDADFTVRNSSITGNLGGYPSIYAGCHWGNCTPGGLGAHPVRVTTLTIPGTVTTSWDTTQPGGSAVYNAAYDLWFNQTPATTGQPNGAELMVWLNRNGSIHPLGSQVGTATIDGVPYRVWEGAQSFGDTICYVMARPTTSVSNLDVGALAADALRRGYIRTSWYLIDVEAGFELWRGGAGLATDSFSVNLSSGRGNPAPAPSPASTVTIAPQTISRSRTAPGIVTNATVDFTTVGPAMASNATLVIEVLNSAGAVVGSRSWTGQNVAPHQALNETYAWTASTVGTYTVEGLVRDSSGKMLQRARAGTITVNPRPSADH